jgi:hypothetical protein
MSTHPAEYAWQPRRSARQGHLGGHIYIQVARYYLARGGRESEHGQARVGAMALYRSRTGLRERARVWCGRRAQMSSLRGKDKQHPKQAFMPMSSNKIVRLDLGDKPCRCG